MNVLLLGGAGFIGSHVADALVERGHSVTIVDDLSTGRVENIAHLRGKVDFVRDAVGGILAQPGADCIIHLAAMSSVRECQKHPAQAWHDNVITVETARKLNPHAKFIFASSGSVYGHCDERGGNVNPLSVYAQTKLAAELLLKVCAKAPTTIFRIGNVYGPRQRPDLEAGVIAKWMKLLKDDAKSLPVSGDGAQTRDFVYVKDVARIIADEASKALDPQRWNVQTLDLATGHSIPIAELANVIWSVAGELGSALTTLLPRASDEVLSTKLRAHYLASTRLSQGLRETWNWWKEQP